MSFHAIILDHTVHFAPRADLLFTYCGTCKVQLAWRPRPGYSFYSSCCNHVYNAEPMSIDLRTFQLTAQPVDMSNVRRLSSVDLPNCVPGFPQPPLKRN